MLAVLLGDWRPVPAVAEQTDGSWFEEVGERAGIKHKHTNRSFKNPYAHIMQGYTALGAAVAVGDYNGDGFEDVFVTDFRRQRQESALPQQRGFYVHGGG